MYVSIVNSFRDLENVIKWFRFKLSEKRLCIYCKIISIFKPLRLNVVCSVLYVCFFCFVGVRVEFMYWCLCICLLVARRPGGSCSWLVCGSEEG